MTGTAIRNKRARHVASGPEEGPPWQANRQAVGLAVLDRVGRPDDLARLSTHHLYDGRYRVNLYRERRGEVRLAASYWVRADAEGRVLESRPPAVRIHWDDVLEALHGWSFRDDDCTH